MITKKTIPKIKAQLKAQPKNNKNNNLNCLKKLKDQLLLITKKKKMKIMMKTDKMTVTN